jgi:hypothetical protein
MKPRISLRKSLQDSNLLGDALAGDSWRAWRVLLIAAMGEALDDNERALFKQLTLRERESGQRVEEFVGVIGRRGGKSRAISVLAGYISCLCDHPALVRGERGVLLVIAPDQRQAAICLDYIEANLSSSPILRQLVEQRTQWSLRLTNKIDIEVRASEFRRLRGPTYIAVICDESAFWYSENSANPDSEILASVRPGLATTGGPLFMISSPYARKGELWRVYQKHFGASGDPLILVAQGSSRTFNPTLSQAVVDRAMERDAASAAAEYGAEFRRDLEEFVSREAVLACVSLCVYERPREHYRTYLAFVDPSGGSSDSMTLCIGHRDLERKVVVVDAVRDVRPPFSPEAVCREFSDLCRSYGNISKISGDRYAGQWPLEQFSKFGIRYEQSAKPKSDLYLDLLPLINSRRIELLDNAKLINQLVGLERRTARGGRDSIDHAPGLHDDLANSIAGLAWLCTKSAGYDVTYYAWMNDDDRDSAAPDVPSADRRLNDLYGAIDGAIRWGMLR